MADDFDWTEEKEDIAVRWQGAIAVYRNKEGALVIRQEGHVGDEDQFVVVRPENLRLLVDKLLEVSAAIVTDEAVDRLTEEP